MQEGSEFSGLAERDTKKNSLPNAHKHMQTRFMHLRVYVIGA